MIPFTNSSTTHTSSSPLPITSTATSHVYLHTTDDHNTNTTTSDTTSHPPRNIFKTTSTTSSITYFVFITSAKQPQSKNGCSKYSKFFPITISKRCTPTLETPPPTSHSNTLRMPWYSTPPQTSSTTNKLSPKKHHHHCHANHSTCCHDPQHLSSTYTSHKHHTILLFHHTFITHHLILSSLFRDVLGATTIGATTGPPIWRSYDNLAVLKFRSSTLKQKTKKPKIKNLE